MDMCMDYKKSPVVAWTSKGRWKETTRKTRIDISFFVYISFADVFKIFYVVSQFFHFRINNY